VTTWVTEDYEWHRLWYRDDYGFLVTACRISLIAEEAEETDELLLGTLCPECVPDPSVYGFAPLSESEKTRLDAIATEAMQRIRAELGDDAP